MHNFIEKYFKDLAPERKDKLYRLEQLYLYWNSRINLVSRKDMDSFMLHHIIHSLSITRIIAFKEGTRILDAGTGGGLPGIPLSIVNPAVSFTLVDSIRKKIKVVDNIRDKLGLENVEARWSRVEDIKGKFDFVISRAVAPFSSLVEWTADLISSDSANNLPNGIIALKGGDLREELSNYPGCRQYNLRDFFNEEFFEEKKIIYMPLSP